MGPNHIAVSARCAQCQKLANIQTWARAWRPRLGWAEALPALCKRLQTPSATVSVGTYPAAAATPHSLCVKGCALNPRHTEDARGNQHAEHMQHEQGKGPLIAAQGAWLSRQIALWLEAIAAMTTRMQGQTVRRGHADAAPPTSLVRFPALRGLSESRHGGFQGHGRTPHMMLARAEDSIHALSLFDTRHSPLTSSKNVDCYT